MFPSPSLGDRLAGGLAGLLIGDALGVPFEFRPAAELPPVATLDFQTPMDYDRSHAGTPPGTWSDDGAQALCLLDSLMACNHLDLADFAQRLLRWRWEGAWAVDGRVFDVGSQTQTALGQISRGVPPEQAGGTREYDNGNGSLMRVLPLALWHTGDDLALVRDAARQSLPTHGHPRSQIACAMYCLWVRAELNGQAQSWEWAARRLRELAQEAEFPREEVAKVLDPERVFLVTGAGYVLDTLYVAKIALEDTSDYASAVRAAIGFGNDTDTTAAVTGGLAGVRYGLESIPLAWRTDLRGQALVRPLLQALLARAGAEARWPAEANAISEPPRMMPSSGWRQWLTRWRSPRTR